MVRKIILDTNFLLIPSQFNVDIFTEINRIVLEKHQLFVLDKTIDELKKLSVNPKQSLKNRRAAKLGLQLLKAKKVKVLKTKVDESVDDILASIKGYTIATQDIGLKRRIKGKKIVLRAKKKLIFA